MTQKKQLSPAAAIAQFAREQKAEAAAKAKAEKLANAKPKRTKDEIFATQLSKAKSTGNPALDTALAKIVTSARKGEGTITKAEDGSFSIQVGKVTAKVARIPAGKVQKTQLEVAGLTVHGSYANMLRGIALRATAAPRTKKAVEFAPEQVEELASLLAD